MDIFSIRVLQPNPIKDVNNIFFEKRYIWVYRLAIQRRNYAYLNNLHLNRRLNLFIILLWLRLNVSNEVSNTKIINHRSFLRKERSKKLSLDPRFSFFYSKVKF